MAKRQRNRLEVAVHHELVADPVADHDWLHDKIERVAKARQHMMDSCRFGGLTALEWSQGLDQPGPSALFMVDTDVILGPGVLERMWAVDADVVYGTFWTRCDWGNSPDQDTWPQVWSHHPYKFDEDTWNALVEPGVNEVPVYGGGACTLIRGRGFESSYLPLESLKYAGGMWAGEDRSFNLGLETRGIKQIAVTGLPICHMYDEDQRTAEDVEAARKLVGLELVN